MGRAAWVACAGTVALVAIGCASPDPFRDKVWAKANESYAGPGDYEYAEARCGESSQRREVSSPPPSPRHFIRCMRDEGWVLVDRP